MTILNVRDANTGKFLAVDLSNPSGTLYVNDENTGGIIPVPLSSGAKSLTDYQNVVVVDAGGNGDYTTQAAAAAAITDDDASHVYNVFVFGEAVALSTWANRPYIKVHGNGEKYKVYSALLTHSGGTDAVVATVLENTLSGIPVWSRADVGTHVLTLEGAFPPQKTVYPLVPSSSMMVIVDPDNLIGIRYETGFETSDTFTLLVTEGGIPADGWLGDFYFEVRVYP